MISNVETQPVGNLLRDWRRRRHLSQLDLACEAEISTRHLSFLETGRSLPSREMLLHLAEQLEVPLRERNVLLMAAGYAPVFSNRPLDDPTLQAGRRAVELILAGHEPYPAIAVDRHWTLIMSNQAITPMLIGLAPVMLEPPVNVLRLSLHPLGLASRIVNLAQWRTHLLARLRRQVELSADPVLADLLVELSGYPVPIEQGATPDHDFNSVAVPFQLSSVHGVLSFISTTTIFGTPVDITLSELAVESFFPADAATAEVLRAAAGGRK